MKILFGFLLARQNTYYCKPFVKAKWCKESLHRAFTEWDTFLYCGIITIVSPSHVHHVTLLHLFCVCDEGFLVPLF